MLCFFEVDTNYKSKTSGTMNFFGRVAQSVGGPMVGRVRAACMSTMHITHYDVLKVELDATASDIKKAYLVSDYVLKHLFSQSSSRLTSKKKLVLSCSQ